MAKPTTYKQWSTTEMQYIVDNYGSQTAKQIADHLGRTKSSVEMFIHNTGIGGEFTRKLHQSWADTMLPLIRNGWTSDDIAEYLGISRKTVYRRMHHAKLVTGCFTDADIERLRSNMRITRWGAA